MIRYSILDRADSPDCTIQNLRSCLKRVVWRDIVPPRIFFLPVAATNVDATGQNKDSRVPSGPRTPTLQTGTKIPRQPQRLIDTHRVEADRPDRA